MIPKKYLCPECKGEPIGTAETVLATALITFDKKGKPHYDGESDVDWNSQTTQTDPVSGCILFVCGDGHTYPVKGVVEIE